jgi:hypothetical protein
MIDKILKVIGDIDRLILPAVWGCLKTSWLLSA